MDFTAVPLHTDAAQNLIQIDLTLNEVTSINRLVPVDHSYLDKVVITFYIYIDNLFNI